jgi:hypothetical protein
MEGRRLARRDSRDVRSALHGLAEVIKIISSTVGMEKFQRCDHSSYAARRVDQLDPFDPDKLI